VNTATLNLIFEDAAAFDAGAIVKYWREKGEAPTPEGSGDDLSHRRSTLKCWLLPEARERRRADTTLGQTTRAYAAARQANDGNGPSAF